ncbi:MAG TPA: hypothetical protein VD866_27575 [Urbifossiella sp.]|nr:hypothetical protein [Urbifossiella sp.]
MTGIRSLAVLTTFALLAGCGGPRTPADGGARNPKAQENRKLAETYAVAAATGAATAEVAAHPELEKKSLAARAIARVEKLWKPNQPVSVPAPAPQAPPPPPPVPTPEPVARVEVAARPVPPPSGSVLVRERVACEVPMKTEAEAEEATIQTAADRLQDDFMKLDPPLDYRPSPAAVKADFLRRDSRLVRPPTEGEKTALARAGYAPDRVYVEYTLEATAEQVREIRGRERVGGSLKLFGLLAAAAAVGFVFLRVDAWSQGYLTSWLAFIAAALAGGAVAAYLFA